MSAQSRDVPTVFFFDAATVGTRSRSTAARRAASRAA